MGGQDCKPVLEYNHQCAAAAEPAVIDGGVAPYFGVGPTVEAASDYALKECPAYNGGRACEIKYTNCTLPYLVYD